MGLANCGRTTKNAYCRICSLGVLPQPVKIVVPNSPLEKQTSVSVATGAIAAAVGAIAAAVPVAAAGVAVSAATTAAAAALLSTVIPRAEGARSEATPAAAAAARGTASALVRHRLEPRRHVLMSLGQQVHERLGNVAVLLVEEARGHAC